MGRHASSIRLEDGQIVAIEGDPAPPACFVLSGCVRVFRTNAEGREQTVSRLQAPKPDNH